MEQYFSFRCFRSHTRMSFLSLETPTERKASNLIDVQKAPEKRGGCSVTDVGFLLKEWMFGGVNVFSKCALKIGYCLTVQNSPSWFQLYDPNSSSWLPLLIRLPRRDSMCLVFPVVSVDNRAFLLVILVPWSHVPSTDICDVRFYISGFRQTMLNYWLHIDVTDEVWMFVAATK
jgi:hypothetical protein